jgi:dsDNA-specific endonuclease/ATPase MutS2
VQASARRGSPAEPASGAATLQQLTIQFEHNSIDVRGMRVDEIPGLVDEAIAAAPSGTAVFIVHGMGTGRLKAEVHSLLKRSRQVWFELLGFLWSAVRPVIWICEQN